MAIIPPPKSYSSSISDDDRNNEVNSPCSIIVEGTTVDDTEDNDVTKNDMTSSTGLPNGHVDSEEDSGVHVVRFFSPRHFPSFINRKCYRIVTCK